MHKASTKSHFQYGDKLGVEVSSGRLVFVAILEPSGAGAKSQLAEC